MARNVELKARVSDPAAMRLLVRSVTAAPPEVLVQRDTFFRVARGRLKLRETVGGTPELVYYERPDRAGPKTSIYARTPVADPASMREFLSGVLGEMGVVSKRRELSHVGATRVHLDEVEGLGWYLELEVVLSASESEAEGERIATEFMTRLGLGTDQLVPVAYVDLLANPQAGCALCSGKLADAAPWIEVHPEGEGISCVTVDVTVRLCPDHRRRLLETLDHEDGEHVEPVRLEWR